MDALSILTGNLLMAGVFAVLVWMRSKRAAWVVGRKVLIYSRLLKALVLTGLILLVLGLNLMLTGVEGRERLFIAALLAPIVGLYMLGAIELVTTHIAFDEVGIYQSSIFARTNSMSFQDLASVEYSAFWDQHVLRDELGGSIRVSKFMAGAEELVAEAQVHLAGKSER